MKRSDDGWHDLEWLLGFLGLLLPWLGAPLVLAGLYLGAKGDVLGWLLLAIGVALFVLDYLIDVLMGRHPAFVRTDVPALNQRGHQLVGRTVLVVEAIIAGRGRVRVGDSLWIAEGADAPIGRAVVITGVAGTVLRVRLAGEGDAARDPAADPGPH